MKKKVVVILLIVSIIVGLVSVNAVASTQNFSEGQQETVAQEESTIQDVITIIPDNLEMATKEKRLLTMELQGEKIDNQEVIWSTENSKVATVKNGEVTAKALGKTTVTGTYSDLLQSCEVIVNKTSVQSIVGRKLSLMNLVENIPDYKKGKWSTSNKKIATVDSEGRLKEISAGSCNVTFKGADKTKYIITVRIKKVTINKKSVNLYHNGSVSLSLKNADGEIKWTSANKKIAKVSSKGKVKAVKRGKTIITATYLGVKFKCNVRVYGKKLVAITFDDGPSIYTESILNTFKKYDSKATFFVVGNRLSANKEMLKRASKEGHEIGNHTWSHPQLTALGSSQIKSQLKKTNKQIKDITGKKVTLLRPPYGACNQQVKSVSKNMGLSIINWSVDTLDWKTRDQYYVSNVIMNQAGKGKIILCHDLYNSTAQAMKTVVPKLVKKGYDLVTVTELLESDNGKAKAGIVYFNR